MYEVAVVVVVLIIIDASPIAPSGFSGFPPEYVVTSHNFQPTRWVVTSPSLYPFRLILLDFERDVQFL